MTSKKPQLIDRKDLSKYLNRPVWFQSAQNVEEFGWAFIHPDTVTCGLYGTELPYCRLIRPDSKAKDMFSWLDIQIYDKPAIKRLCSRCMNWVEATPGQEAAHCSCHTQDGAPRCSADNGYKSFQPTEFWSNCGYSAKTYKRQLAAAGFDGGVA